MQRGVEGTTGLENPVADVQELPHGGSDYDHLLLSSLLQSISECLDRWVEPKGRHRREVHCPAQPGVSDLRHLGIASHGGPRLSVARHEACVGSYLARALEPFGRSDLAYDDRGSLESNPRDRLQQREATLQPRILLDMLLDLFFQVFELLLNFLKKAAMRAVNRLILSFI